MRDEGERIFLQMLFASIGGSIVAVWAMPWQKMSTAERLFAFVASVAFGFYGAPILAAMVQHWFNVSFDTPELQSGIRFFGAALGLFLIPVIQAKAKERIEKLGLKKEDGA